ncbi:hypothetical protein J2X16_004859 [Pelomonas aquatica]|uniref:Uncharacterized protein n=1 Tax=Pelomonas aquatica TaxID=431058 RepID=A0ABU1ZFS8_9BURK|nr:hypothetical protein [Pelomonas aquatica]
MRRSFLASSPVYTSISSPIVWARSLGGASSKMNCRALNYLACSQSTKATCQSSPAASGS